jgi:hypothetical protein
MTENFSSDSDYLLHKVNEDILSKKDFLATGNAKDYAEYRQVCGIIRGLESVKQLIIDLAKRREDADD